jgi:hypothetical protein
MTTLNLQVNASGDDNHVTATIGSPPSGFLSNSAIYQCGDSAASPPTRFHSALFTGVSGINGSTIDSATLSIEEGIGVQGVALTAIFANDTATPVAPTTFTEFNNMVRTTASVAWDDADVTWGAGFNASPDIKTVIQELADDYDPSSIIIIHEDTRLTGGTDNRILGATYDESSAVAPKLDIDYTAGSSSTASIRSSAARGHSVRVFSPAGF